MRGLCVLYDETCGFCCRCAEWLRAQEQLVPLMCVPKQSREALEAFGSFERPGVKAELIVIDSEGAVYRDADAWVMSMWALRDYRSWAARFARPSLKPMARSLFEWVSTRRHSVSKLLALEGDSVIQERLQALGDPGCDSEVCVSSR